MSHKLDAGDQALLGVIEQLRRSAEARRAEVGAPRFPAAWQKSLQSHAPAPTARRGFRLRAVLHRLPLLGPAARLAATIVRLPRRLGQYDAQLAQLLQHTADTRAYVERTEQQLLNAEAKIKELYHENHQRHQALQKLLRHQDQMQADTLELGQRLRTAVAVSAAVQAPAASAASAEVPGQYDDFYWNFEQRFRGSPAEITRRLELYSPYLTTLAKALPHLPVLDLGCGRGEWLQLVQRHGLSAKGIDLNMRMVRECQEAGLDVTYADAVTYLKGLPADSIGAVSGFHIVEHLPFAALLELLHEAFRVVAKGGFVLFETPNPENILVGACTFYTDPTHKNPLPPPALGFMLEAARFRRQECLRMRETPLPDPPAHPATRAVVERFHTGSDYAIIGFKDPLEL